MSASEDNGDICTVKTPSVTLRILEDVSSDEEEDGLEDAIGRFVWPTAVPLLRHLLACDNPTTYSMLVELGAGCGVLGMGLAAAVGTGQLSNNSDRFHVVLTDHDSDWLQRNVALNETVLSDTGAATIEATRLSWGSSQDIVTVKTMVFEELSKNGSSHELMIVGSDILYNHDSHKALASTLYQLSETQPTRILLGFPDRDNDEETFVPIAREFFGDILPSSTPIIDNRKIEKRRTRMDLRVIDFCVNYS